MPQVTSGPLAESSARKLSPALFFLVLLCFFLPFMGVSCSNSAALNGLGSSTGGSSQVSTDCLNNIISYTGFDMVRGAEPAYNPACSTGGSSSTSPAPGSSGDPFGIGIQIFAVLAVLAIVIGLIVGALAVPFRAMAAAGGGALAFIFLLINQSQAGSKVISNIANSSNSSGGSGGLGITGSDVAAGFSTTSKIGYILALVLLAAVVLYNLAILAMGMNMRPAALATEGGYVAPAPAPAVPPAAPPAPPMPPTAPPPPPAPPAQT